MGFMAVEGLAGRLLRQEGEAVAQAALGTLVIFDLEACEAEAAQARVDRSVVHDSALKCAWAFGTYMG